MVRRIISIRKLFKKKIRNLFGECIKGINYILIDESKMFQILYLNIVETLVWV